MIIPDKIIAKKTLLLTRDKHIINIYNSEKPEIKMRYNLKLNSLQKESKLKEGGWTSVKAQYKFFEYMSIGNIYCKEEKFLTMIERTAKLNPRCTSVSTFFNRLKDALVYENYDDQGIKTQCDYPSYRWGTYSGYKTVLTKPVSFYKKNVIKAFKKYDVTITTDLEGEFVSHYEQMTNWVTILYMNDIEEEQFKKFIEYIQRYSHNFKELIRDYNYDFKSLFNFIFNYLEPFENLEIKESADLLRDYYRMADAVGRKVKRYPKYLKSMHDIITANYNAYKQDYDEAKFLRLRKENLEHEGKEYCIVTPECSKDIISEGTDLNHCVGSYVDQILKEKIYIFFLRLKKCKEESLVTLELKNNKITQAKGSYNRPMTEEEAKFIKSYASKKLLEVTI